MVSLRKEPRQKRSKVIVEAIAMAAAKVLRDEGFDRTTTTRVAEVAGVSVGSLYQYFDSREQLLGEVWRRYFAEFNDVLERTLARSRGRSIRATLEELTRRLRDVDPKLAGELCHLLPLPPAILKTHEEAIDRMVEIVAADLTQRGFRGDAASTARFVVDASQAVIASANRVARLRFSAAVIAQLQRLIRLAIA